MFDAESITVDNWHQMYFVRMKPLTFRATQLHEPFRISDEHGGDIVGEPGDYLIINPQNGQKAIVSRAVFEAYYDILPHDIDPRSRRP